MSQEDLELELYDLIRGALRNPPETITRDQIVPTLRSILQTAKDLATQNEKLRATLKAVL